MCSFLCRQEKNYQSGKTINLKFSYKNAIFTHTLFFTFFSPPFNCNFIFQKRMEKSLYHYAFNNDYWFGPFTCKSNIPRK